MYLITMKYSTQRELAYACKLQSYKTQYSEAALIEDMHIQRSYYHYTTL